MEKHNIQSSQSSAKVLIDKTLELRPGEISPFISWELRDIKTNALKMESKPKKANSFVNAFLVCFLSLFGNRSGHIIDISRLLGTFVYTGQFPEDIALDANNNNLFPRSITSIASGIMQTTAAAGVITQGIVIGSGLTPPTFLDNRLESQIAHGVAAGQLQYGAQTYGVPTEAGGVSRFRITRVFSNTGAIAVDVAEVGLLARTYSVNAVVRPSLFIRDLFGVVVSVPVGQSLTINYDIQAAI